MLGKMSPLADWVAPRSVNAPNRDRATTTPHRCAAQKGQYSAPMYTTRGLPSLMVRAGWALIAFGVVATAPAPTWSSTAAGTVVTAWVTVTEARVEPSALVGPVPSLAFAMTSVITAMRMRQTAAAAHSRRRLRAWRWRCRAWIARAASRWASRLLLAISNSAHL